VSNGSGLSRGDRNRNARLARLRELVPLSNAIVGIGLADGTRAAVVTDHDSRVIAPPPCQRPGLGSGRAR
jgi:transposase